MAPLSLDLRHRIVTAYQNKEGTYEVLAKRFSVSPGVVGKLVRQQRNLGTLKPQTHRRGRKRIIQGESEERLREHLKSHADATLAERIETLKVDCTVKTMWKALQRLGWRFKKSHHVR